jgi:hypothetical protein
MMTKLTQAPLYAHDLKALGDPGAAVQLQREQGAGRPVDWSQCGLVAQYGLPGEPGHSRTSERRRVLVA